ncbi:MFS transporter [Lichenibacterium dinghuense]|uniref:MFS transporter n=1 Tax=Lichenibacterium dinghuense TaxID=2895977 RepID=UPI001F00D3D0|nr:MFS transporter [Lichenibacterium sp. 6Y81]
MTVLSRSLGDARWSERAAILAVFLQLGLFAGAWAAALPAVKSGLALSDRAIGLALLTFAGGSLVSTLATGALSARVGTRRAIRIGVVATAITMVLPAFARSLLELALATASMGVAMGLLDVSMNGAAGALEERWGAPLMSSFHGAFSLGGLGGAALGGALAGADLGALGQLGVAGAVALTVGAAAAPFLGADAPASGAGGPALALPGRRLLGLGVVAAFCFMVEGAMGDWSAIYLDTVAGSGLALASAGYAGFSIAMAGVRFAGDGAVARLGARAVLVGGGLLAGAGLLLAVLVPVPLVAAVGFGLVGLGLGNVAPVAFSAAARTGSVPAAGVAPVATVGYAGFLLGPPVIGFLSGAAGLRAALACLVVATAVVAAVGYGAAEGRRSRT